MYGKVVLDVCGFAPYKAKALAMKSLKPHRFTKFLRKRLGSHRRALRMEKKLERQSRLEESVLKA